MVMNSDCPRSTRRVRWTPRLLLLLLLLLPLFPGCKGWDTPFNSAPSGADPLINDQPPIPTQPSTPPQPKPPAAAGQPANPTPQPAPGTWSPQPGPTTAGLTTGGVRAADPATDP